MYARTFLCKFSHPFRAGVGVAVVTASVHCRGEARSPPHNFKAIRGKCTAYRVFNLIVTLNLQKELNNNMAETSDDLKIYPLLLTAVL